jgi:hypothetical protein
MTTTLVPNREIALRVGYVATDWTEKPPYQRYADALTEWEVQVIARDDKAIGAAFKRGPEFHVSILPEWRSKWATRGLLNSLIERPVSVTKVTPGHERMYGILMRLGFRHEGSGVFVRDSSDGY